MLRAVHYHEDIVIAKALISSLQANVSGASSYLSGDGESPSSSTTNLDAPEGAAALLGVWSVPGTVPLTRSLGSLFVRTRRKRCWCQPSGPRCEGEANE